MLKTKIDGWLKDRIWRESSLSTRQAELNCKTLPRLNLMSHGGRFCFIVAEPVGTHLFFQSPQMDYTVQPSLQLGASWSGQCKMSRAMRATSGLARKHHSRTILHILFLHPLSDWVKRVPNRQKWVGTQDRTGTGPSVSRKSRPSPTSYTNANWIGMWLKNDLQLY